MDNTGNAADESRQPSDIERVIIDVLKTKGKMDAVETYGDITGQGIRKSTEMVEGIISKYDVPTPGGSGGGCAGVLVTSLLALLLLYMAFA